MKIGILTFHRAINYGAFLQAFALQKYLINLGHQVEMIDYWPKAHEATYKLFYIKPNATVTERIKTIIAIILKATRFQKRRHKMLVLQYKYFNISKQIKYSSNSDLFNLDVDCIVYGSDQVWWNSNIPNYKGFDDVYFGGVVSPIIKRIAYAPSMGVMTFDKDDQHYLSRVLKRFDLLSVRETDLRDVLQPLTERPIEIVLDPVFLLDQKEWATFCTPLRTKEKYVLFYNVIPSKLARKVAEKLAEEKNCQLIELTGRVDALKYGKTYVQTANAFEFLSYIRNAESIVSTSFHGVAFSILFEKDFYALGMKNNSGRVASLLRQLDITHRLCEDDVMNSNPIDYNMVNKKLFHLKETSIKYLKHSLMV